MKSKAKRKRLTDADIRGFKQQTQRYEKWEGDGLGVRISPRGVKTFVMVYHYNGKARRLTLGRYVERGPLAEEAGDLPLPVLSLAEARERAAKARKLLEQGLDPGAKAVAQRKAERAAETVGELVAKYLKKYVRPRKRSAAEDERMLTRDVLPAWGDRKAKDISRRDVIALLDRIVERGAPIQANRVLACVRRMFNWAVGRDMLPANPCAMVKAPAAENRRDRVLSDTEIAAFWRGIEAARMAETTRLALRFQLATAQRKGEVIGAEWSEIDLDNAVWTIPPEKAKNKMAHRVPLSPLAVELLASIKANAGESQWLFPSPRGARPINATAVDHALRRNLAGIGLADLTPHDLRRSAASHMTGMGINRLVVGKILNHAEKGVTSVYDRHGYDPEKRHALDAWGRRLDEIVTGTGAGGGRVVALRRG